MNSTEITTFFEEQKAAALKMALEQEGDILRAKAARIPGNPL